MLTPLETYLITPFISFMHFRGKLYKSSLAYGTIREEWIKEDRPPILTLSGEDYERGWNCLKSLGVPKDAWFVTLHVREPGWRDGGSRCESFRNADITTYLPAIKAITDAGGWVLRMGDQEMSKLQLMPQVIDYAHSQAKSDWMDVFLCAQCRFMMGTSSGLCVVAATFGVPLVMTNMLPGYAVYHFTSKDLLIPRLCFSKDKERCLNFSELISPPVGTATTQFHFDNRNIQINPEEIKALVEEMLEKRMGTLKYSEEDEILQKEFKQITANCGKVYGDLNLVSHVRIGRKFLRKHKDLLRIDMAVKEECQLLSQ
jgi:putative glycosyltransferase (TIGR04372 family)